jgi:phospholipase/carboxylesterase
LLDLVQGILMMQLSGPSLSPRSGGKPKQLVVFLHGYGSNGDDLIGLAPYFQSALPDAAFLSPNAPFQCELSPMGYQWFGFEDRDPAMMLGGVRLAGQIIDAFLDAELSARGLTGSCLVLIGFSQGTMMSLHVAPRRERPIAGVLGYSGSLIAPEALAQERRSKPPVLLVHGTHDPVVPFQAMEQAAGALRAAGLDVDAKARPGLPHSIDQGGIEAGLDFVRRIFSNRDAQDGPRA